MKRIDFTGKRTITNADGLLHIETPMGIVNIRVGLTDLTGRPVESIEIIPSESDGVTLDGFHNSRLIGPAVA